MPDFEEFFERNYPPVVRALALAFPGRDGIEDVVQDSFALAFVKWSSVGSMTRPATWVYVVAARRMGRSLRRTAGLGRLRVGATPAPREHDAVVERVTLERLLDGLPPRQRATVVLRYLADLSVDEVARALHCAPGTVKAATNSALGHLRADMEENRDA